MYPTSEIRPTAVPVSESGIRASSSKAKYRPRRAYTPKIEISRLACTNQEQFRTCVQNGKEGPAHGHRTEQDRDDPRDPETVAQESRANRGHGPDVPEDSGVSGSADFVHSEHVIGVDRVVVQSLVAAVGTDHDGRLHPDRAHSEHGPDIGPSGVCRSRLRRRRIGDPVPDHDAGGHCQGRCSRGQATGRPPRVPRRRRSPGRLRSTSRAEELRGSRQPQQEGRGRRPERPNPRPLLRLSPPKSGVARIMAHQNGRTVVRPQYPNRIEVPRNPGSVMR